jgi:2-keto-4-pentenoate hydratase
MPWLEADLDAETTDEQRAEINAAVEHDVALLREWHPEWFDDWAELVDDMPFEEAAEPEPVGLSPRYEVHLRLVNPDDLPCKRTWLMEAGQ